MASNLVSFVMQLLTPDMIGRIATMLGLDSDKVQRGVGAAVPAILAGLGATAMQPGGAQKVADAAQQQSGTLGNLAGLLSGNQSSLASSGSQLLSSLLGNTGGSALANAVGKFSGLGQGAGSSLLGVLAPIVLGGIAQQSSGDMSAKGIAGLLSSQKDNIAAALPSGFSELLGGTGLLDSLGGSAQAAATAGSQAARSAASSASSSVSDMGHRAATSTAAVPASRSNWLYWLIASLIVLAGLFYVFGRPTGRVAQNTAPATTTTTTTTTPAPTTQTTTTTPATPAPTGIDISKQVTDSLNSLQSTVTGITDVASAQAALPKLKEAQDHLDKIGATLGQLSADQRQTLSSVVAPALPKLNELFDKILAIPGVSDVLKPTIDAIKEKLASLAA